MEHEDRIEYVQLQRGQTLDLLVEPRCRHLARHAGPQAQSIRNVLGTRREGGLAVAQSVRLQRWWRRPNLVGGI
jgi:hypothetical protein